MKKLSAHYRIHRPPTDDKFNNFVKKVLSNEIAKQILDDIEIKITKTNNGCENITIYSAEFDPVEKYKIALDEIFKDYSDEFVTKIKQRYNL